jgi:hypothetical protein
MRTQRKIARLRKDENWLALAIRQFYLRREIPLTYWVKADEIYDSPGIEDDIQVPALFELNFSGRNLDAYQLAQSRQAFIRNLQDSPSIETAILRVKMEDITLVRPKWLRNEVLSI